MKFGPIVIAAVMLSTSAFAGSSPTFITFDHPSDPTFNQLLGINPMLGINSANIAAGFYNDANGNPHGYAYTIKTGVFSPVTIGGGLPDAATGINLNNLICGFFVNAAGRTSGFLKPLTGGQAITFAVPNASVTQFLGVNNKGFAVGLLH